MQEMFPLESMGETGENVAERWQVTRADQDAFALESQRRWAEADAAGRFADELMAVGDLVRDEHPRPGADAAAYWPSCGPPSVTAAPSPPATRAASTTAQPRW